MANDVLTQNQSGSRRFAPLGIIFGLLGLLLFAYFVSRAGVGEIISNIQRLGANLLLPLWFFVKTSFGIGASSGNNCTFL